MDLKQIEYFVRVAELGSFTQASVTLDVAQSALSRHVRLLETELRQNLLIRNGRGVTPTEAGKILLEHGRGVLHQVDRLREELARERGGLVGKVALGLPPGLSKVLTVPLMRVFREAMPDAVLSIREGLSLSMLDDLNTGRLDVALLYDAAPFPDIELQPVITQSLYLVQSRHHAPVVGPISLREVAELPLIIPSRPNVIRMHLETELANLGMRPNIGMEVDAISAILELIVEGVGNGILPTSSVHAFGRAERYNLRPIKEPRLLTRLSSAVSTHRPMTQVQRNLLKLVESKVRELVNPSE
jgi:LysR family transcriptional regulator, nitrogen assimilation regulatory protein